MRLNVFTFALAGVSLVCASGCRPDGAKKPLPGNELYAACTSCHGADGYGQENIAAPAIAGLPAWYVEAQLTKFRTGVRGAHPDDLEGLRMRPMSRQMMDEGEVKSVAAYVASMPSKKQAPTVKGGDASAGAAAYATCLACHGPDGKGNQALNAPPIVGQHDWYLVSQLHKFKKGIRGANPKDVTGGQMRPMSMTLADDQAIKNVVAHIDTLSK
jgi:cytochrome c553